MSARAAVMSAQTRVPISILALQEFESETCPSSSAVQASISSCGASRQIPPPRFAIHEEVFLFDPER